MPKNNNHEWEAVIYSRMRGLGCPYCSGKKVSSDNCLAKVNPEIAKEWHPTKNGKLTALDVTSGSPKRVWWQCQKHSSHEWQTSINNRGKKNHACPFCSGQMVSTDNCLQKVNPELAKEWHPNKNQPLTPRDVTSGSNQKIWWKCSQYPDHEWKFPVTRRNKGAGCPYCSGRRVSKENCLHTINPILAKQWHPTKNGELMPRDVSGKSAVKVWWQCVVNPDHIWESTIWNRHKGSGCPYCSGRKKL